MQFWRMSLLGARILNRSLSPWLPLGLLAWALWIKLQEPTFLRRQEVPFYWASLETMLYLLLGLLPLAWLLGRAAGASSWARRLAQRPWEETLAAWLSIVIYGTFLLLASTAAFIAVDSIHGAWEWYSFAAEAGGMALGSFGFLMVMASLAPALTELPLSKTGMTFFWLVLLAAGLCLFGPGDVGGIRHSPEISGDPLALAAVSGILSKVLATLGGLCLSLSCSSCSHPFPTHQQRAQI